MPLKFGATIGIIGGGQLGRMLAMAAARLGLKACILEPQDNCPAAQVANHHLKFAYDDRKGLELLAEMSDVVTYEFENIPVEAAGFLEQHSTLYPSSKALELSQDRLIEKNFIKSCGLETALFFDITSAADIDAAMSKFSEAGVLKTRRLGYDGKGQFYLRNSTYRNSGHALAQLGNVPCILEEMVDFGCEISVIAARGTDGTFAAFDPAENSHADGILRKSVVPANVSPDSAVKAIEIARCIVDRLEYVGVIGIELFVLEDDILLVNEIAPRVHNSGHWTEAACAISQFEQHIRAISGWPLGKTNRHSNCIMENIIGEELARWGNQEADTTQMLHIYGKSEVRPGRKMGHVTRLISLSS